MTSLTTSSPEESMDVEQQTNPSSTVGQRLGSSCTLQEYLFNKHFENIISRPCSIKYLSHTITYSDVAEEYNKFLDFIENHEEPGKTQLTVILFPIFVHFYLVLLQSSVSCGDEGDNSAAHEFYKQHSQLFENAEGYQNILKDLYLLESVKDVQIHPMFKNYWKMKYTFKASLDVHQSLKSFLDEIESKVLLYVLRFHFYSEGVESTSFADNKESEHSSDESVTQVIFRHPRSDFTIDGLMNQIHTYEPCISGVVIRCNLSDFSSIDLNEDKTQICIAHERPYISTAEVQNQQIFNKPQDKKFFESTVRGPMKQIFLGEPVFAVKYLPDNSDNILVSSDTVKLLNADSGKVLSTFQNAHSNSIVDFDVNSPVKLFATASTDMSACVWSLYEPQSVRTYLGHIDCVNVVKFHPNGFYLATGSADNTVRLWSIDRTYCIRSFIGHKSAIRCIAYSPDGKLFATGDLLGIIRIWNINDNSKISEMEGYDTYKFNLARITSLCFSYDSCMLASCNFEGTLKIWDIRTKMFCTVMNFRSLTPILIKSNQSGIWDIVFKEKPAKRK